MGNRFLINDASRSHSDTPPSVGLLSMSDQTDAETSTWQYTQLTKDRHPWPRRDSKEQPSKPAAADPRLDPLATEIGTAYKCSR